MQGASGRRSAAVVGASVCAALTFLAIASRARAVETTVTLHLNEPGVVIDRHIYGQFSETTCCKR
jgi:hypothetical protein